MKGVSRSSALRFYLFLNRLGTVIPIAVMALTTVLLCWFGMLPRMEAEVERNRKEIYEMGLSLRSEPANAYVAAKPSAQRYAEEFYGMLGSQSNVEQQVKILLYLANEAGLSINQADYKLSIDRSGKFHTYQIQLPVSGSYGAVRRFCEWALLALPYMAMNEMAFKRESVSNGRLEAKLRFTLYLSSASNPGLAYQDWQRGVKA